MAAATESKPSPAEIATVADEAMQIVDKLVRERLGRPYYVCTIVFPAEEDEPITWAANATPSERSKFAAALIELLIRWGFIKA